MSFEQRNHAMKMPKTDTTTFRHLYYNFCYWLEDNNPFAGYVTVSSAEEYINLPRNKRTVFSFWYLRPYIVDGESIFGRKSDRDAIDTFNKYKFPVQYFLRENAFKLKCKISRGYDWLRYAINPRQKWLTKQIPNSWCDKVTLIRDLNFAMVVHFIDEEKCFEYTDYEGSSEAHAKFAAELKECYNYIKIVRPTLQVAHDNSYPTDETHTGDYHKDYAEVNRLEKEIEDQDTKWLTWIVTNRGFLWT